MKKKVKIILTQPAPQLKNNIEKILKNINLSKQRPQQVVLLAASKTQKISSIVKAHKYGIKCFGENRVQEAIIKKPNMPKDIELHLIGHLQRNKTKKAINIFDVIQTIDSMRLAEKINQEAKNINKTQRIYCQINIGQDLNKTGFSKNEAQDNIKQLLQLKNLHLEGIMTILPQQLTAKEIKSLYLETKTIRDRMNKKYNKNLQLSMGMSDDYKLAVECGSNIVRIGTKLFGERK